MDFSQNIQDRKSIIFELVSGTSTDNQYTFQMVLDTLPLAICLVLLMFAPLKSCTDRHQEKYRDITILVCLGGSLCTPYNLPTPETAPKLHWVHFLSAGFDWADPNHPLLTNPSVTLTTSSGIHGPQIAEWVLMTLLSHNHQLRKLEKWQAEHHWGSSVSHHSLKCALIYQQANNSKLELKVTDLQRQRIGILGYGSIGRQVARVCKSLGMSVVAFTASPRLTPASRCDTGYNIPNTGDLDGTLPCEWHHGFEKPSLHKFLSADLDVLLVAVPLTAKTTYLLSDEEFEILGKKRAFVINIARGKVLDQEALIDALRKGSIRGAALDVTDPEPLPKDSDLWAMENVFVTPHVSGLGDAYASRAFGVFVENFERCRSGTARFNVVDRRRGY
jgi:phosphoglycerate dehydrogenase-like enzyme